ncbi:MAG: diaminopimelate decarboxylase [Peptostreptococcaceae bacterium]|nr:diaminopimelate decarboxylase [Peptostreptococcaceae bacterium]
MNNIIENKNGILYFDGCNTLELVKKYGTPLYVMSETDIVDRFNQLKECFVNKYPNTRVAYASKAFCTVAMYQVCKREGTCIDVVSGGELYTAIKAEYPPERIEFNGNNKLRSEIELAVEYGIGRIIVDGLQELSIIEDVCKEKNKRVKILYRITPGVKSSSHDYIVTGKKDSKFGIPLDDDVIMKHVKDAIDSEWVDFLGFHYHVGSQLFDNESHLKATKITLDLIKKVKEKYDYNIREINLGGGFGVKYTDEVRKPYEYFITPMMEMINDYYKELGVELPAVVIEPGRSIVAEAGISLYTIGSTKEIRDVRKYVSVDGGMPDNIRPALYQAEYDGVVANKLNEEKNDKVSVCGKCCESGDILIKDIDITSTAKAGDVFAIFSTGAYGYSMASNYNGNPIPAVVMVKDGESELIVKAQSYEEMICNQLTAKKLI